ncbi:hypothetical protein PR048_015140 [Dryococelus australis]|uniref:Uncharacterized protein n=1 Tax=Dryococelus australis TaxID=614101 RepID=A0ABQ9HGD1_9NEOP|nr:hypothetical protein PR048_015140 [Dryococelus australis]
MLDRNTFCILLVAVLCIFVTVGSQPPVHISIRPIPEYDIEPVSAGRSLSARFYRPDFGPYFPCFLDPMKVIEVSMEQRRNERAGKMEDSRENLPMNVIVCHDSHMRISGNILRNMFKGNDAAKPDEATVDISFPQDYSYFWEIVFQIGCFPVGLNISLTARSLETVQVAQGTGIGAGPGRMARPGIEPGSSRMRIQANEGEVGVCMNQCRNEKAGETGNRGESPQTSDIVRHDSHNFPGPIFCKRPEVAGKLIQYASLESRILPPPSHPPPPPQEHAAHEMVKQNNRVTSGYERLTRRWRRRNKRCFSSRSTRIWEIRALTEDVGDASKNVRLDAGEGVRGRTSVEIRGLGSGGGDYIQLKNLEYSRYKLRLEVPASGSPMKESVTPGVQTKMEIRKTYLSSMSYTGMVAERLARSPPTKAIRIKSLAGFRMWELCLTMPVRRQVFSGVSHFPRTFSFRHCFIPTSIIILIGSQDLDVKSRPNIFTHVLVLCVAATNSKEQAFIKLKPKKDSIKGKIYETPQTLPLAGGFSRGKPANTTRVFHLYSMLSSHSISHFKGKRHRYVLTGKSSPVSLLATHQGDPCSIPGRATPDFRKWESCRTMPLFPPPLHSGATPHSPRAPSSALKTSMLRAIKIFSLTLTGWGVETGWPCLEAGLPNVSGTGINSSLDGEVLSKGSHEWRTSPKRNTFMAGRTHFRKRPRQEG